jgi:hypothetical protein
MLTPEETMTSDFRPVDEEVPIVVDVPDVADGESVAPVSGRGLGRVVEVRERDAVGG